MYTAGGSVTTHLTWMTCTTRSAVKYIIGFFTSRIAVGITAGTVPGVGFATCSGRGGYVVIPWPGPKISAVTPVVACEYTLPSLVGAVVGETRFALLYAFK